MKKVLAIVLALVTLFACVVPASAANHMEETGEVVDALTNNGLENFNYADEFTAEYFENFANFVTDGNYVAIVQKAIIFTYAVLSQAHAVYHQLAVLCHFHCYMCNEV